MPVSDVERAPDLIAPLVGWRLRLVVADGGYLWLESVLYPIRRSPRVIAGERGWRGEHAYPDTLYVANRLTSRQG
jgi:hypothetical protein